MKNFILGFVVAWLIVAGVAFAERIQVKGGQIIMADGTVITKEALKKTGLTAGEFAILKMLSDLDSKVDSLSLVPCQEGF